MALTQADKREIETLIKKEIKAEILLEKDNCQ
jgi:hypothetical protein